MKNICPVQIQKNASNHNLQERGKREKDFFTSLFFCAYSSILTAILPHLSLHSSSMGFKGSQKLANSWKVKPVLERSDPKPTPPPPRPEIILISIQVTRSITTPPWMGYYSITRLPPSNFIRLPRQIVSTHLYSRPLVLNPDVFSDRM